jgi:hypothetical protein
LPHAAAESVLAIATDPEPSKEGGRPMELVSIDPMTGVHAVLAGVKTTPPGTGPLIPSLGSLSANAKVHSTIVTRLSFSSSLSYKPRSYTDY